MESVSFETFGCSANVADTETLKRHAENAGYSISDSSEIVILNTCAVKGPTQTAFEQRVRELEANGKKVVLAGCIPQSLPNHPLVKERAALGPDCVDELPSVLKATERGELVQILKRKKTPPLPIISPEDPKKPLIVPISQGCLSSCSFCLTKLARGNLRSYPIRFLREKVSAGVAAGKKEVFLTSQDTSAYGLDLGVTLVDLLEQLIEIPGEFRIRIGMGNPQHFPHFVQRLWPLFESEKLYRFLHIPVQSGSESVLLEMRRDHTARDYVELVQEGRARYPDLTIATDIIAGYPTESEDDHQATLSVLRASEPDAINLSRFWPRPNTRAARLAPLPGGIVKERSREITHLFHRISRARNRSWLGWKGEVFFTEKNSRGQLVGRNYAYKQVISHSPKSPAPSTSQIKISDYGKFDIRGIEVSAESDTESDPKK